MIRRRSAERLRDVNAGDVAHHGGHQAQGGAGDDGDDVIRARGQRGGSALRPAQRRGFAGLQKKEIPHEIKKKNGE